MEEKNTGRKQLLLTFLIALAPVLLLSGTTGKIVGRTTDNETGEPLIGVNIILEGTSLGAATDLDGYFMILNVQPGLYSLRASMIGYKSIVQKNVEVVIDLTTTIDFALSMATIEGEEVVVYAKVPAVKMDVTSTSFRVSSEQIEQLQVEDLSEILDLQAGVYEGHFRGGRANEVMYIIDGIPMNDMYSGDASFELDTDMIQQVEIISGTFNAEHGQAMSGIVNVVTKEGQDYYKGKVSFYSGDYLSNNPDLYLYIDQFHPLSISDMKFSLSGPVLWFGDKITFFVLGRSHKDDGWMYGQRLFMPSDYSDFSSDRENPYIESSGDNKFIPMNPTEEITLRSKITWKVFKNDKVNFSTYYWNRNFREYEHLFRYNPNGNYQREDIERQYAIKYNHVFSPRTFIELNISQMYTTFSQYVYKDRYDARYVDISYQTGTGSNGFSTGGMRMWQHRRSNLTNIANIDLTSQITKQQKVVAGLSLKSYKLWLHEYQIYFDENDVIKIPSESSWYNNSYVHSPSEVSAYIQDKIELGEMIINAGLRYDYFEPDGVVPEQFYDTRNATKRKAKFSHQLSPRFGIAYPISDEGVIHFSYGRFFQVPNFEYLYINPDFEVSLVQISGDQPPRGRFNSMGNAELKPQNTVTYEIGFKQGLTRDLTVEFTVFNKDIRDLIGQETLNDIFGGKYWRFINRDYANVIGITVALEQRETFPGSVGFSVDYTYQTATGNASDPNDEWLNQQGASTVQSEKKRRPLDWDQTHLLNISVTTTQQKFHISLIGKMGSGTPYTRSSPRYSNRILNGERKPMTLVFDLNISRDLRFGGVSIRPYIKIYNLLDRKNNREVYNSSGSAEYAYEMNFETYTGIRTQEEFYRRPNYYYEPRKIKMGFSVSF